MPQSKDDENFRPRLATPESIPEGTYRFGPDNRYSFKVVHRDNKVRMVFPEGQLEHQFREQIGDVMEKVEPLGVAPEAEIEPIGTSDFDADRERTAQERRRKISRKYHDPEISEVKRKILMHMQRTDI